MYTLMLVWVEIIDVNGGAPSDLLGQVTRGHSEWPESLSLCPFFFFSSFLPLPESVGKLDWRSGKIESCKTWITQSAVALTGGKRASAGSLGSHTVIIQCSPPSACLSLGERPTPSLWMSRLQTGTVSGPLWYWLILPGRTRQLVDRWEGASCESRNRLLREITVNHTQVLGPRKRFCKAFVDTF